MVHLEVTLAVERLVRKYGSRLCTEWECIFQIVKKVTARIRQHPGQFSHKHIGFVANTKVNEVRSFGVDDLRWNFFEQMIPR
jgi:hypothetical protein